MRAAIADLATSVEERQTAITEQWLLAVQRDTQIAAADRLTHQQLLDNLPNLYREYCIFLRTRDAYTLTHEVKRDAKKHGELRWQSGYRIDEVIRELEVLRHIVCGTVLRWQEKGTQETHASDAKVSAIALTNQFFAEVSVASVKQFMDEQQSLAEGYMRQLKEANAALARSNVQLAQTSADQRRISNILTDELQSRPDSSGQTSDPARGAPTGAFSLQALQELLAHSEWVQRQVAIPMRFSPPTLFAELVSTHEREALERGLQWQSDCSAAPSEVTGDRETIKRIAAHLLSSAIVHTIQGTVRLQFTSHAADRWKIVIQDSGPALSETSTRRPSLERPSSQAGGEEDQRPIRAIGLSITQSLVVQLGGSLQVVTRVGTGTLVEVILPSRTGSPGGARG